MACLYLYVNKKPRTDSPRFFNVIYDFYEINGFSASAIIGSGSS